MNLRHGAAVLSEATHSACLGPTQAQQPAWPISAPSLGPGDLGRGAVGRNLRQTFREKPGRRGEGEARAPLCPGPAPGAHSHLTALLVIGQDCGHVPVPGRDGLYVVVAAVGLQHRQDTAGPQPRFSAPGPRRQVARKGGACLGAGCTCPAPPPGLGTTPGLSPPLLGGWAVEGQWVTGRHLDCRHRPCELPVLGACAPSEGC